MALDPFLAETLAVLREQHAEMAKQITGLPAAALEWKPGPGTNSLAVLVLHCLGTERSWLSLAAAAAPLPRRNREAEFRASGHDAATLLGMLQAADSAVEPLLGQVDPAKLGTPLDLGYTTVTGQRTVTPAWAIQHTVDHLGQHVGHMQLTRQLWDQGWGARGSAACGEDHQPGA
ncbi:MAG: DUF664 domain-containing protein [Chloroflexi bacterium]|nr:DUF664 domain-containing protein [Chloroflexota bacterium]